MMTMFMNILLKRFAAADLKDALIRSALVADRTVKMTLRGMCYNQRVPLYKLFYEAVMRLLLDNLAETKELDRENLFSAVYSGDLLQDLKIQWNKSCFTLPKFRLSFIDMVGLLLNIIYSGRLGRWELLLEFIREVIPYAFAYDHVNYARYLTVMLGECSH